VSDLTYAAAGELLERYRQALVDGDGDAFVDLHAEHADVQANPFEAPLAGRNAIRRRLLDASVAAEQVEFVFERHWVVPPTVLTAWHGSFVDRQTRARVRLAGFATFEVAGDGRIDRARYWFNRAATPAGQEQGTDGRRSLV